METTKTRVVLLITQRLQVHITDGWSTATTRQIMILKLRMAVSEAFVAVMVTQ